MLPKHIVERTPAPHAVDVFLAEPELPFFAEYALFCLAGADYESQGDCARPTDRRWSWLDLRARAGPERLLVFRAESPQTPPNFPHPIHVEAVSADLAWLGAYYTMRRTPGVAFLRRRGHYVGYGALADHLLTAVDVDKRWERCKALRGQFESQALRPYDSMTWWGGWKWEGADASPGSWPLRQPIHAVLTSDRSALPHLFDALRDGVPPERLPGYVHALAALTGKSFVTLEEWLRWWRHRQAEQ